MKITIIIPTYKPKEYIYECLNSIKNQTLKEEDFEVLLILNGMKNPYYENILDFIQKKKIKNIRLVYTDKKSVSNARNLGLDEARGDYIAFIDDDDYIDEDYLEIMLNSIKNKKFYICSTNYKNFCDDNIKVKNYTQYPWNAESNSIITYRKIFSSMGAKIIPRCTIGDIRFNTELTNSEDALFMSIVSKNVQGIKIAQKESYYIGV